MRGKNHACTGVGLLAINWRKTILQDPTVGVIQSLLRRVDAHQGIELGCFAVNEARTFTCLPAANFRPTR